MSQPGSEPTGDLTLEQQALRAVRSMRRRLETVERAHNEPIAVIGMACRFPGSANTPELFWNILRDGRDVVGPIPQDRWDVLRYFDERPGVPGRMYVRHGAFVDDIDQFDAAFFGISPREANAMDPQHRMLLEVAWEALERAGQPVRQPGTSGTGVFVALYGDDYSHLQRDSVLQGDAYTVTGNIHSAAAGRISHVFDFMGPSVVVDTACSASLVATHLACQSLRAVECDMALAGGAHLIMSPLTSVLACQLKALAADGRCKTFDARADGYVRGEGCGVLVLKRLSSALADGDTIQALLLGSAVTHDGHAAGLTAPNAASQRRAVERALRNANIDPSRISYVEAHGTGTSLGDPIEVEALTSVLGAPRADGRRCALASVKTNIGHTEATAGIASLIKVILALQHEQLPPHLHLQRLNPRISFAGTPFFIPTELTPWSGPERLAGVSSFGISGTNAHVIVGNAPDPPPDPTPAAASDSWLLPISARTPAALDALAAAHVARLATLPDDAVPAYCRSAARRRGHFEHRMVALGKTRQELSAQLEARRAEGEDSLPTGADDSRRVVFVCPGQGSQWAGMGRTLLAHEPVFAEAMQACAAAVARHGGFSLLACLRGDAGAETLDRIDVVQPALFAMAVSLSALWQAWGLTPAAVIGHSMGELAAAQIAGALSLDDAARVICVRSRLLRRVSGQGAMGLVELPQTAAAAVLAEREDWARGLAVAAANSRATTVIAGDPAALDSLLAVVSARGIFCRRINVDVASHSPQVDALLPELRAVLASLSPRIGSIPMYSTVTGAPIEGRELTATYWADNLRKPVLFASTLARLIEDEHNVFLELSPHPLLLPDIEATLHRGAARRPSVALSSLRRAEDEELTLRESLARLYTFGCTIAWDKVLPGAVRPTDLPTYPWQHERFWIESPQADQLPPPAGGPHPFVATRQVLADPPGAELWTGAVGITAQPWLGEHRVQGAVVLPGAAYLDLALATGVMKSGGPHDWQVEATRFEEMLVLPEIGSRRLELRIEPLVDGSLAISCFAGGGDGGFARKASSHLRPAAAVTLLPVDISAVRDRCAQRLSATEHYRFAAEQGLEYGPAFQRVREVFRRDGEALARITVPDAAGHIVHPAWLDAAFQVVGHTVADPDAPRHWGTYVPASLARLTWHKPLPSEVWAHVRLTRRSADDAEYAADIEVLAEDGTVLLTAEGFTAVRLERSTVSEIDGLCHQIVWRSQDDTTPTTPAGRWLIVGDRAGIATPLTHFLVSAGATALRSDAGDAANLDVCLDAILTQASTPGAQPLMHVVDVGTLVDAIDPSPAPARLRERQQAHCLRVLRLVQRLVRAGLRRPPRVWLVTRGAQAVDSLHLVHLAAAPLWGMGRALYHEHPELTPTLVDLDPTRALDLDSLQDVLCRAGDETQIAVRQGQRFVARLARQPQLGASRRRALPAPHFGPAVEAVLPATATAAERPALLVFAAASHALDVAAVRPRETVLILDSTEPFGEVLFGLARDRGLVPFVGTSLDLIRARTNGQGVDVVVTGFDQPPAWSLAALADGGRFVDCCPRERRGRMTMLAAMERSQSFLAVDLPALARHHPAALRAIFDRVATQARSGSAIAPRAGGALPLRADGAYLITGGLGGLGLVTAQWLVEQGARHLWLLARRERSTATESISALRLAGAEVRVVVADVSNQDALASALREIERSGQTLRGVVHSAGVLDDATILHLEAGHFDRVFAPKADGAYLLHELTKDQPLDFFVLFSSAASLYGAPAQANHAAANAALDALAHHRAAMGLSALSINWGPWSEVGQAAGVLSASGRDRARGISAISPSQGLEALSRLLGQSQVQVGIVSLDARQWRDFHIALSGVPVFSEILAAAPGDAAQAGATARAGLPHDDPVRLRAALERVVREQAGKVFRMPPEHVDVRTPLRNLGLDSLMGLEIRNRLEATLGLTFSATLVWTHPTVERIAEYIAGRLAEAAVPDAYTDEEPAAAYSMDDDSTVPDLSLEEAEALLLAEQAKVEALLKDLQ